MSDEQHRIMDVVVDDPPESTTPKQVEGMLQDLNRFESEYSSNPSRENFDDWCDGYTSNKVKGRFGSWNSAVEAAGGEPNSPNSRGVRYDRDQVDKNMKEIIESENDWKGRTVPKGEVPPDRYIDNRADVPNAQALRAERWYGEKDGWAEKVSVEKARNADDVDVDREKYFG